MTRVLIVDDKEDNLYYLQALLSGKDYTVDSARHGAEALVKARQSPPDVVISDLLMPVMDGYTLLRHWKADKRLKQVPFIVYTATYTKTEDEQLALNLGADAFILKPAEPEDFLARLGEVLANAASTGPILPKVSSRDKKVLLKVYSETLIHKLEEKTLQLEEKSRKLEETNRALQQDIIERRHAEEEVKFKNTILLTQQETSLDGILVVGENDQIISYNHQFIDLWQISPHLVSLGEDAPVLKKVLDQTRDPEAFLDRIKYLYAHRDEKSREEVKLKDGRIIDRYSSPVLGTDGRYYGRVWYFRDITERKTSEHIVQESEKRFRAIFNQAPIAMALLDKERHPIYTNSYLSSMLGYSNEEFLKMQFSDFTYPDDNAKDWDQFAKLLEGEISAYNLEKRYVHKNGHLIWANLFVTLLRDENGDPQSIIGMAVDITEQHEAREKLMRNATLLRIAGGVAHLGGWSVDTGQNRVYWSDEVCMIHDMPIGSSPGLEEGIEFYAPEYRQAMTDAFMACVRDGTPFDVELQIITAKQRRVWMRAIGEAVRDADGIVRTVQGAIQDISDQKAAADAMHKLGDRLVDTLESINDAFFTLDRGWRFTYINAEAERLLQRRRNEMLGRNIWEEFKPAVGTAFQHNFQRALAENVMVGFEEFYPDLEMWFEVKVYPSNDGLAIYFHDVTERKTAEARIKYLNRVQAMLSGINTLIVRVQERDELFRGACRIAVETGGFSMALLVIVDPATKKAVSIVSEGKDEALMASVKKLLSTSMNVSNTMVATAIKAKQAIVSNDSQNDPRVLLSKQYTEAGIGSLMILPLMIAGEAVGTFTLYSDQIDFFHEDEIELLNELASDIAFAIDHLDKQRKLNYLAYYDALTGLANRTLFLERVDQFIRNAGNGHRIAVFLIDLERFKNFNDSFGQPTGDKLLKHVAEWLSDFSKDANLVAHIDADHFAAVMPQIASDGKLAHLIENALASLLENSFQLEDAKFRISAKIGAALFPDDGADAETLFRNAEAALKTAKKSGSRYLFHTKKMTEAVISKLTLENQLRQAIDNEDFVLHYQPKVNLASGTVTGAEALIRWNDPRTGLVPPGKFIPILEETGLIYEVGRWALRQAIADHLRWRKAGLPAVRIAVNVSPLQLRDHDFVAEIERNVSIDLYAAEGLELEITESMIMTDIKHSISMLKKIRRMGVTIAVDDFGTGFSSLGYLAKLPVDTLKIDRSFVVDMSDSPEGLALMSTIISLAHALKLKVVAEGVETEEQSHLLHLLSCDQIQGYLFSKPVPCEEFETKFLAPPPPINDKGI